MRRYGFLLFWLGFFTIGVFWNYYLNNQTQILNEIRLVTYTIIILGLLLTAIGGLILIIGIRIMIKPQFYSELKEFIKG